MRPLILLLTSPLKQLCFALLLMMIFTIYKVCTRGGTENDPTKGRICSLSIPLAVSRPTSARPTLRQPFLKLGFIGKEVVSRKPALQATKHGFFKGQSMTGEARNSPLTTWVTCSWCYLSGHSGTLPAGFLSWCRSDRPDFNPTLFLVGSRWTCCLLQRCCPWCCRSFSSTESSRASLCAQRGPCMYVLLHTLCMHN